MCIKQEEKEGLKLGGGREGGGRGVSAEIQP